MNSSPNTAAAPAQGQSFAHSSLPARSPSSSLDALVAEIRQTHRMHQQLLRAEKRLQLQIKAIERRLAGQPSPAPDQAQGHLLSPPSLPDWAPPSIPAGAIYEAVPPSERLSPRPDPLELAELVTEPLRAAMAGIRPHQLRLRRRLVALAKELPVWPWVDAINGFGAFGLAQIVGEAGNLSNYRNVQKLWKRMGMAVIDGEAQRKIIGAAALEHRFNPERRAIMFFIGDSLLRKQNYYRDIYLARKAFEAEKTPDTRPVVLHRRAHRYAEKRLLRNLWRAWRDARANAGAEGDGCK